MANKIGGQPNDIDDINDYIFGEYKKYVTLAGRDLVEGAQYSSGHLFQGVTASGGTAEFLLRNPSGSGVYIFAGTRASTSAKFYFNKETNPTVSAAGTVSDITQRRVDSASTPEAEAYHTPTVTEDGNAFNQKVVGSGGQGGVTIGSIFGGPEVLLAPGDDLFVKGVNQAGTAEDISIDVDFTEIPETLIDELDSFSG